VWNHLIGQARHDFVHPDSEQVLTSSVDLVLPVFASFEKEWLGDPPGVKVLHFAVEVDG